MATGAVFLFHCGKFFDPGGWHLTNPSTSDVVRRSIDSTSLWLMPLFFILSGLSTMIARGNRSALRLLWDRVLRLLLPFGFGVLVIVPPQVWVERVGKGAFEGSYWAFYPHYFEGWYGLGGNFAWMGLHLWFLALLFLITLLFAPLLPALARLCFASPYALALPVVVMSAVEIALIGQKIDARDLGGWSIVQYPLFFMFGALLSGEGRVRAALERFALPLLVLGVIAGGLWAWAPDSVIALAPRAVWRTARVAGAWGMLYGLLGLAARHAQPSPRLDTLSEASMPFYILHQTVILLFAFWLLSWGTPIPMKYAVLAGLAFPLTALLTRGVLRVGFLRPLFGLKRVRGGTSRGR